MHHLLAIAIAQARKPGEEWLELTETQMTKGVNFLHQQMEAWSEQAERMDAYMASVRALADEMALKGEEEVIQVHESSEAVLT